MTFGNLCTAQYPVGEVSGTQITKKGLMGADIFPKHYVRFQLPQPQGSEVKIVNFCTVQYCTVN